MTSLDHRRERLGFVDGPLPIDRAFALDFILAAMVYFHPKKGGGESTDWPAVRPPCGLFAGASVRVLTTLPTRFAGLVRIVGEIARSASLGLFGIFLRFVGSLRLLPAFLPGLARMLRIVGEIA
jgi:hypothetical protein